MKVLWLTPSQTINWKLRRTEKITWSLRTQEKRKNQTKPQDDKHASGALHNDKSNVFVTKDNAHNHSPQENERSGKQIVGHHQISSLYLLDT
jgi:hypothetical protein